MIPEIRRRVALVTGASSGMGRAIAVALAGTAAGAVAVHYHRNRGGAEETAERVRSAGAAALTAAAELRNGKGVRTLVGRVEKNLGSVGILVSNVGPFLQKPWDRVTASDWERMLGINLVAAHACIKAVLPGMRKRGWGRIITIGYGRVEQLAAFPGILPYAAAKAGLLLLTRTAAAAEAGSGITANMVSPGLIRGGILPGRIVRREVVLGSLKDVAAAVRFLASDEAAGITGANILIAGTWRM